MIAPFALGALADGFGLQWAFLIVPVLAVLGVALVAWRPVPMLAARH
jgi:fucose permease